MTSSRKKRLPLIIIPAVLAAVWVSIGAVDFARVNSRKLPIFCVWSLQYLDGGSGTYTGLGYSFEIKGDFIGEEALRVTEYTAKIFGVPVLSAIQDKIKNPAP